MLNQIENIKGNILIVDDNQVNLDVLRRTLENEGHNISAVLGGKIALKLAPRSRPDLILLDIMMPEMDGFETCKALKENPITKDIPIIFVTASNRIEDIVKGFEVGAVDYITKPIKQQEVSMRVKTHLVLQNLILSRGKMIAELESNNKKLVEANELKNKFLGMAAHDLRNPLAAIKGFSEILIGEMSSSEDEDSKEFLSFIYESSQQLLGLVNDLLDYSVVESGNLDLQLKKHSLKSLVEKRIKVNQYLAGAKNIKIENNILDIPEVFIDDNKMGQVLDNLLSNAVKYSQSGTTVSVEGKTSAENLQISVKDEGQGISADEQKELFQSFSKLSSKPTAGETCTGLGLAIVKKIVTAHGGNIEVQSEPNVGSVFSFSIPLKD